MVIFFFSFEYYVSFLTQNYGRYYIKNNFYHCKMYFTKCDTFIHYYWNAVSSVVCLSVVNNFLSVWTFGL